MHCLQEADLHVSSAAVRAAANNDRIVVEMPAAFDVAGDAGSIGRFALQPNSGSEGIYIDIKGVACLRLSQSSLYTKCDA